MIGMFFQLNAQTVVTWDGGGTTDDWSDAANWSLDALPTASEIADLDGNTVILTTDETVQRVDARGSSDLTINAGVTLTITGFAGGDDGLEIQGSATVTNNGTINISNITGSAADGLYCKGSFTNAATGVVTVDGTAEYNIYVQGGNFTNNGTITLTNFGQSNSDRDGINVDDNGGAPATFNNNGTITITMTGGDDGIYVNDGSTFNNSAMITIDGATGGDNGIRTDDTGNFDNQAGGILTINATLDDQIFLDNTGLFSNSGTINLNNSGDFGLFITDEAIFTNMVTGVITITDAADNGLYLDGNTTASTPYPTPNPILHNFGMITVNNGPASKDGLRLNESATFNNNAGGTFTSNNSADEGIQVDAGCTINNSGTVDIIDSGDHGMELFGTFNNMDGGLFKSTDAGDDGMNLVSTSVFGNDGSISIDGSFAEDIEVNGSAFTNTANAKFLPGSSPGDMVIKDPIDLGEATLVIEITGTTPVTEYDVILHGNSADLFDISAAKLDLQWGAFVPAINDCFLVLSKGGSGTTIGPLAAITSSNPQIEYTINYDNNDIEICVTALLPVDLSYFEGKLENATSLLNWQTQTEENNDYFEVQYSTNGREFSTLDKVAGNGTTTDVQNYNYTHKSVTSHDNYYRLKQVDFDGDFEYSDIIYLQNDTRDTPVAIYPNPTRELVTYEGTAATLTFFDIQGRQVMQQTATNERTTINISILRSGVYTIEILTNTGERRFEKLIKE